MISLTLMIARIVLTVVTLTLTLVLLVDLAPKEIIKTKQRN